MYKYEILHHFLSRSSLFGSGLQRPLHTGVEYADSECQVKILLSEGNLLGIKETSRHSLNPPGGMELGALA